MRRHNFPFWLQTAVSNFFILIKMSVWTPSHPPENHYHFMKRLVSLFLLAPLAIVTLTLSANGQKAYKIALSNSFYGNTWRKQMVDVMQKAANEAKAQGLISDFAVDNGDGTANTQLAQLNSLILSHPDAILVNAASPTALNGA